MRVTVAYAAPGVEALITVELPAGATAADAVEQSGIAAAAGLDLGALRLAIFGQAARPDTPLADGDRVELTRPLLIDPKAARRARAAAAKPKGSRRSSGQS